MALPMILPAAIAIAAEFFPLLATRLGGKRGERIAAQVVDVAATVAGVPADASARDIVASLKKDPARVEALRVRLAEIDMQSHEAEIRDRESARAYQVSLGPGGRMRGNVMLAGVVVGLVACVVGAALAPLGAGQLALVTTIAGALLKMLSDAFAFEFGSSAGSKEKDQQIERFQKALIDVNQAQAERAERAAPPTSRYAEGGTTITDGSVVAVGDATVIDASDDPDSGGVVRRRRDFVGELRKMAGTG